MSVTTPDSATHRRRQALVASALLSSVGVLALAMRESGPHPGRIGLSLLVVIGVLTYVAPFTLFVDRAIRRERTTVATVVVVGVVSAVFLATRRVGSFTQVWPAFIAMVSIATILAVAQVRGVVAASPLRRSTR